MTTITTALAITKQLAELELSERIIRDYILSLDGCDALRFSYKADASLYYTPYVWDEGEYLQGNYTPSFFDADDFYSSTLISALVELASTNGSEGMIAVNPDNDSEVLLYR